MDSEKNLELESNKKLEKSEQSLNDFLNEHKGIEYLWRNIEKKKNATKKELRIAEKELVETTTELGKVIGELDKNNKKDSYRKIIEDAYKNNSKGAEKFIEKFPNWSIAIGKMFSESPHYLRVSQSAAKDRGYKDITSRSNFELKRTGHGKINRNGILGKIKSGWKSLKTAFSNYIKPDDIGKASKSSLARRIKKFGEEVNRPWRMWWDFAALENAKLSKDEAKTGFKNALKKGDPTIVANFFNRGKDTSVKTPEGNDGHELAIVPGSGSDYTQNKGFAYMNKVIEDLDKNLLKDIQVVFNVTEDTVKDNIKNSDKITASKIFQADKRKPEDYEKFFDILGIKDYNNSKNDDAIIEKITELLKEIEGKGKLTGIIGESNAKIIKFLKLARANYVIKNNKMEGQSEIIKNLNEIKKIFDIKTKDVEEKTLLNKETNGNDSSDGTKKIISEIEKEWDKEIAKKFTDAINNILAPTDKQNENIKKVENALDKIKTKVNQCEKLKTEDEVKDAIEAIKTCKDLTDETNTSGCRYNAKNGRKQFLADVAVRLGVRGIAENNIQSALLKSEKNLEPPYDKMPGAELVQKLRNLIGYGLGYGTSAFKGLFSKNGADSLPDLDDDGIVNKICESLEIKKKIVDDPGKIEEVTNKNEELKKEEPKKEEIKKEEIKKEEIKKEEIKKEEIKKEKPKLEEKENEDPPKAGKEYDENNLNVAKKLFEKITNFGEFKKGGNLKVETAEQVTNALNAIKSIGNAAGYQKGDRKNFLGTVAKYLGLTEELIFGDKFQKGIYNGDNKLKGKYVGSPAAEFVMHLRNLIAYGLGYGDSNDMPDIALFDSFSTKIANQMESMKDLSNNLDKMIKENSKNVYSNALNVINDFEVAYKREKSALDNFKNFKGQIETKCKNNKVYLVLFNELFEKLKVICEAIDNKTGKK